jgi:hypothetical protein
MLARAATEDETVEDLRRQVRRAVRASMDLGEQAEALSIVADELAHAGQKLERTIRRGRRRQVIAPAALGLGTIALGAAGGVPGLAAGALGTAASLLPYLATRGNRRQDAAYLFFMAQRRSARGRGLRK